MSVAWLFPGQGTQFVGMGKSLFEESPAARDVFERADSALGFSISKLCFEGPESDLVLTKNTQPAIVTASMAALAALKEIIPNLPAPSVAAGHSLGEYSALVAASALTLEDAVRLVHLRGKAMQDAVPEGRGAMAAILGGDAAAVEELCRAAQDAGSVSPANFNAPGQIVIAGSSEGVARASELAGERKLKAIPLKVSAPFHCSLMEPAARAVERALSDIQIGPLAFPVVSNVEAEPNQASERVAALLVKQIDGPVLWEQSVLRMRAMGVDQALEIGPKNVLAGLVRKIDKALKVQSLFEMDALRKLAETL
ncbi:MAG: ACP S-malonyltransferase [Polyangiaceae bacterium]|nr:ACP S-malonyltransferase [Myxococcales bacterium]MCB9584241.1 ACP S-malonyltransferase [Polyangiaceae bacterium]MCB9608596.1 ACP S-malonyltransferase [Polyangiaceae bacterium]